MLFFVVVVLRSVFISNLTNHERLHTDCAGNNAKLKSFHHMLSFGRGAFRWFEK